MTDLELFERIISRHRGLFSGVTASDIEVVEPSSTNLIFLFQHGGKSYVLKVMPHGAISEFSVMQEAGKHITVPKPLSYGEIDKDEYLLMEYVAGKTAQDVMPDAVARMKAQFIDLSAKTLARLHRSTWNIREQNRLATDRLLTVEEVKNDLEKLGINDWHGLYALKTMEMDKPNEVCLNHGDFIPANIIIDKSGIKGVIDWEDAFWDSPLYDIGFTLFVYRAVGLDARQFLRSYIDEWSHPVKTDIDSHVMFDPPTRINESLPFYETLAAIEFYTFGIYAKKNPDIAKLVNRPSNSWQVKAIDAANKFINEL